MPLCSGSVVTTVFLICCQQWKSVALGLSAYEGMRVHASATSAGVSERMFLIKLIVSAGRLMNASSVGSKRAAVQGTMGKLSSAQKKKQHF